MAVITLPELTSYMGGNPAQSPLTQSQQELVSTTIIPGIQQELEKYLNMTVELVQVRESLAPEPDGFIYFTYAPVRKLINAVWSQTGAVALELNQFTPDPLVVDPSITRPVIDRTATSATSSSYRYYTGISSFPGLYSGVNPAYMVVDYIAGYNGSADQGLRTALLRVTAREVERLFDTVAGVRNGSLENVSESDTRQKGWTVEELQALNRLKRRVIY